MQTVIFFTKIFKPVVAMNMEENEMGKNKSINIFILFTMPQRRITLPGNNYMALLEPNKGTQVQINTPKKKENRPDSR